eukprot:143636_1
MMSSYILPSLTLISLITTIKAQECARYKDYPLNVCFNISRGTSKTWSMQIECDATNNNNPTYNEITYEGDACLGTSSRRTLNCTEGNDCICRSNNECDYAFYMDYGVQEPITNISQCNGTHYRNRPIIINQCIVTNSTNNIEEMYQCLYDTSANATSNEMYGLSGLIITPCSNGTAGPMNTTQAGRSLCELECPERPCGRYHYSPINTCSVLVNGSKIQSQRLMCTDPGTFTQMIYDGAYCNGTMVATSILPCTEGTECICNNNNPCEYASTKRYKTNTTNTTCIGNVYEEVLYVLNECLSSRLGHEFQVNTQLTCVNGALIREPCGKDAGVNGNNIGIMDVCDVECPIENVTIATTFTPNITTTSGPGCNRARYWPIGVCLKSVQNISPTMGEYKTFSYKFTCDGSANYMMNSYNDINCTGEATLSRFLPCDGDCYCGFNDPCPYAKFAEYVSILKNETNETNETNQTIETRCGRVQNVPLGVCGEISGNGTVNSEMLTCDTKTGIFTQIVYDDDVCEGTMIDETVYNCTDADACICSDIPCDYVFWTEYSGNKTGNDTCSGDVVTDYVSVLNVCGKFQGFPNVKMTCNNNTADIVNCVDGSTANDVLKGACGVQCFDVNNTLPIITTLIPTNDTCSGQRGTEFAVVINECVDINGTLNEITCDEINGALSYQTCNEPSIVVDMIVCDLECIGDNATIPDTTDFETSDTEDTYEPCNNRRGNGKDGEFDISFYIDCIDETIEVNITYHGYDTNWFGILFPDTHPTGTTAMFGSALLYTIGKMNESIPNQNGSVPKLYLYNITGTTKEGVNYNGGMNGESDWKEISEKIENNINRAEIIYKQDLDDTDFNLTTDNIPIRWAYGPKGGNGFTLGYHDTTGRASGNLDIGLKELAVPTVAPTIEPGKEDNKAGIIIGSVIGVFFALMICFGIIWAIMDNKKQKDSQKGSGYGAVGGADTDNEDVEMQGTR